MSVLIEFDLQYGPMIAGVDEVGRGPLAGPVVAAAVVFPEFELARKLEINDSKKIPKAKHESIAQVICQIAYVSIAEASVEEIDELNILHASMLAMSRAVAGLSVCPTCILVDGNRAPEMAHGGQKVSNVHTIVKGDAQSASIAAASIVAKHYRDRLMRDLHIDMPHYRWDSNAGYGTREHLRGIHEKGLSEHHRKSFKIPSLNEFYEGNELEFA